MPYNLTPSQRALVLYLDQVESRLSRELSFKTGLTSSAIYKGMAGLISLGLADVESRKKKLAYSLTPLGMALQKGLQGGSYKEVDIQPGKLYLADLNGEERVVCPTSIGTPKYPISVEWWDPANPKKWERAWIPRGLFKRALRRDDPILAEVVEHLPSAYERLL